MIIFHNANIYNPDRPDITAMAIEQGRFAALGSESEILDAFSHQAHIINLAGKTIWPGLTDAHVHLRLLAESMAMVDCETATQQECLNRIKKAAETLPRGAWIRGHGWNQNQWAQGYGTAQMLDAVCSGRPAYLTAKSLHAAWANSAALTLAGIDSDTLDPPGGAIQRDSAGQPTGIFLEGGAMALVASIIPPPSPEETINQLTNLIPELWKLGLIGVHDFDDISCWIALQTLHQSTSLALRVRKHIPADHLDAFINAGLRTNFGNTWLDIAGVKLFSDGALGPQTAAMLLPFEGSQVTGSLLMEEEEIFDIGKLAVSHGISLAVHAIGDRANHVVLNAFERLRAYEETHDLPRLRHRIEHVQIIDPADIPRLATLNIIASVQPVHAPSDMQMADRYLGRRTENAYAFKSIRDSGSTYVFGSDAPVEPVNPFIGLHAAVTRQRLDGSPGPQGWHPEQRLSLEQGLYGFSHAPAVIANKGDVLGKIAPGYYADFIILKDDPCKMDPHELGHIKPLATFIEGKCKFQSSSSLIDFSHLKHF